MKVFVTVASGFTGSEASAKKLTAAAYNSYTRGLL